MSGKGSKARPLSIPREEFACRYDMIFKQKELCGTCRKPVDRCGCMPTDDGPGQDGSEEAKAEYERRRFNREGV